MAAPASGATLSQYRAKTAIKERIELDYIIQRPMAWGCTRSSDHWFRCNFAFRRENGTRWYCGYGSARLRGGKVIATYRVYRRCHGTLLPG